MFFRRLFSPAPETRIARDIYALIVAKARQPFFYSELAVPDTIDGRFDMVVLHAILLMNRLADCDLPAKNLSQKIFDEMFADMDRSLREMGVGDLSVGKRIRGMAGAFYGRAKAYRDALSGTGSEALEAALRRNIYPDGTDAKNVVRLANYVVACTKALAEQSDSALQAGRIFFPVPEQ